MAKTDLTQARLRELLHYDQLTGVFTHRAPTGRWGRIPAGTAVGSNHSGGYIVIYVDGSLYFAHRLAWLYMNGEWPQPACDHKDTIKHHNWIDNLRVATKSQNGQNQHGPQSNSKSGLRGASLHKGGRWQARIHANDDYMSLGLFDTKEEAHAAYLAAKARLHPFSTIQ